MVYRRTARGEQAREASREAILAAAKAMIRTHGYDATTMQDIVAKAGTSIGNAYFYFQNKDELLGEVLRRVIDERWADTMRLASSAPVGAKQIATIMYANITNILTLDRQFARAIAGTMERIGYLREASLAQWMPVLQACFPHMPLAEREFVAGAIWGANRSLGERLLDGSLDVEPQELASFAVRWNLRALDIAEVEIEAALRYARRKVSAAH